VAALTSVLDAVLSAGVVCTAILAGRVTAERLLRWHYQRALGDPLDAMVTAELVAAGVIPPPARRRRARPLPPASGPRLFPRGGAS
jgi:hypothetical protein